MSDPHRTDEVRGMLEVQLRNRGIHDTRVLSAMERVPRERFVRLHDQGRAYADQALPIGHHQTISQPFMVAVMTQALRLRGGERVLEVGTGSGYQCAVLAEIAAHVWSMERIPELAERAASLLAELGYANAHVRQGDGTLGWPEEAPFDAILVTAGAPRVPQSLLGQLEPEGGRLVAPVGDQGFQQLVVMARHGTEYTTERSVGCRFVPLVGAEGWAANDGP
jgi:protein-L-isoaspartate(D-aspartate) O-methyltransferase